MNIRKPTDYTAMFAALDALMAAQLPQMELYREIGRLVSRRSEKGAAVAASAAGVCGTGTSTDDGVAAGLGSGRGSSGVCSGCAGAGGATGSGAGRLWLKAQRMNAVPRTIAVPMMMAAFTRART